MRILCIAFFALFMGSSLFSQSTKIALKTGIGGWALGHSTLELEMRLAPKTTLGFKAGVIHGETQTEGAGRGLKPPLLVGFFIKAGPKFYLNAEKGERLAGFALQGQVLFSYWHDWGYQGFGGPMGWRWEYGFGAIGNASYGFKPWEHVLIEPQLGIGWVSTFDQTKGIGDQPPFKEFKTSLYRLEPDEIKGGNHTHYPLAAGLALSFGLMLGITL